MEIAHNLTGNRLRRVEPEFPLSVIDYTTVFLSRLDAQSIGQFSTEKYLDYHGRKEVHGKYAKDSTTRWLHHNPMLYQSRLNISQEQWMNMWLLATCFWNRTIHRDGHLIINTGKGKLARNTLRNPLRPKYHYGEFMPCPACDKVIKLVFRRNKLFELSGDDRYFSCKECGYEVNAKDLDIY